MISIPPSTESVNISDGDIVLKEYYPYDYADSVFAIDYRMLAERGYKAVIFDIDNTLVHHGDDATPEVAALFGSIHSLGLKTLLLTNNDEERVLRFNRNIGTKYVCDADKPDPDGYIRALEILGVRKNEAVMVGDQMFMDIIGANRCGIPSILVHYITVPGEVRIGKKRYLEKAILFFYRRSRKYQHRL